jgi:hypothetical protein
MRTVRALTAGAALLALTPALAAAQRIERVQPRPFTDAWFWGVKTGATAFWTTAMRNAASPLVGAEWLITRSRGALYVSVDQSFIDSKSAIPHLVVDTNGDTVVQGNAMVNIRGLRRVSAAALAFPKSYGAVRPYGGVGLALNMIQHAETENAPNEFDRQIIDDQSSRVAAFFMGGAQAQVGPVSLFGQATYMPAKTRFLLNGKPTYFFETGVRYNIGSALERN